VLFGRVDPGSALTANEAISYVGEAFGAGLVLGFLIAAWVWLRQ
jgi:uncharacterized membrane protein YciS (DUF1049 family)